MEKTLFSNDFVGMFMGMRYIGIDYGSKRVGIAISDAENKFALPHTVVDNDPKMIGEIKALAHINGVKEIVMGESKDYKGKDNKIMTESLEFKKELEDKGFVVHLEPEFMTSVQAERIQGKNEMSDASAAAIILQSYLDRK